MASTGRTQLETTLRALGELLESRGLHYEVVLIGGGNLILRELTTRPTTKDLDLLGEWAADGIRLMRPMPEPLRIAVVDVARTYGLASDWVNLGPASLLDLGLPEGFLERLERRDYAGLVAWLAGRFDMACFKLHAAVDQGQRSRHLQDLRELHPERDDAVVDPEALVALTAELGDADARLRDVSTDWCVAFGRYVNGSRLKQVTHELGTPPEAIGEYVATVTAAGGPAWPMATEPRPDFATRGKARLDSAAPRPRLRIRLRAAFGVNARADVLAAQLAPPGRSQRRGPGAADALRFVDKGAMSMSVRAIEARRVVEGARTRALAEGLPLPNLDASGDEFSAAFDRWVVQLVDNLRSPSRA